MAQALKQEYVRQFQVFGPEDYDLTPPNAVQTGCVNNDADLQMQAAPVSVVEIEDAKVFFDGGKCLVTAPGGEQIARYGNVDETCKELSNKRYKKVKGTSVLLGYSAGAHCYYHWIVDILPRIGILEKAGYPISSIDHFLAREVKPNFQGNTLARLGIKRKRIIETKKNSFLQCERLIHVNLNNGINMKMNRFVPNWLKHVYPPKYPTNERIKLYISRPKGVRRGVSNEDEMRPVLENAGFTIATMEGMTVEEQVALLARADVLVSPHGGALTNMLFCRPGIDVVELFGRHVYPFYYGLAAMCGHRYHAILENSDDYAQLINFSAANAVGSAKFQKLTRERSFEVSIPALKATLCRIG